MEHEQLVAAVLERYGQLVNRARFEYLNGNVADARDVIQAVLLKIIDKGLTGPDNPAAQRKYVAKTLKNQAIDLLRENSREPSAGQLGAPSDVVPISGTQDELLPLHRRSWGTEKDDAKHEPDDDPAAMVREAESDEAEEEREAVDHELEVWRESRLPDLDRVLGWLSDGARLAEGYELLDDDDEPPTSTRYRRSPEKESMDDCQVRHIDVARAMAGQARPRWWRRPEPPPPPLPADVQEIVHHLLWHQWSWQKIAKRLDAAHAPSIAPPNTTLLRDGRWKPWGCRHLAWGRYKDMRVLLKGEHRLGADWRRVQRYVLERLPKLRPLLAAHADDPCCSPWPRPTFTPNATFLLPYRRAEFRAACRVEHQLYRVLLDAGVVLNRPAQVDEEQPGPVIVYTNGTTHAVPVEVWRREHPRRRPK